MAASRKKRSADLRRLVAACLARHLHRGQTLAVGLSGGIDSVVLLHAVRQHASDLQFVLRAAHVDHGLSPNAGRWRAFCEALCRGLGVPLEVRRVHLSPNGRGIEAAARDARYRELGALGTDWVATGHQRDDQAETVLHNLLRGAGVRGAAGMAEARTLSSRTRLLRPLLQASREDVAAYAAEHGLTWIEDESNSDPTYTRNFLRSRILPRLRERLPDCDAALARAGRHFEEAQSLLDELAGSDFAAAASDGGGLRVDALTGLTPARSRNLLRYWLARQGLAMPHTVRLAELLRQTGAAVQREPCVPVGGGRSVRRYDGMLHVVRDDDARREPIVWHGEAELSWGGGSVRFLAVRGTGIAASALDDAPNILRRRRGGESLRLSSAGPSRSLKNLCQERRIPPWRRRTMPLLWHGDDLVWVPGIGVDCAYRCSPDGAGWQVEWLPEGEESECASR